MAIDNERRTEIGENRRKKTFLKILRNIVQLLSSEHFESFTTDDFVTAAGVSRGTFYNYFKTKDELKHVLSMVLEAIARTRFDRNLTPEQSPADRVAQSFHSYLGLAVQSPNVARVMCHEFLSKYPTYPTFLERTYEQAIRHIEPFIADRSDTADIETTMSMISGALALLMIQLVDAPEAEQPLVMRYGVQLLLMMLGIDQASALEISTKGAETMSVADLENLDQTFERVASEILSLREQKH